jgi:hypothetical protein
MPQHPREARCDKAGERKILLWRNATALVLPMLVAEPVAAPITARAMEILVHAGASIKKTPSGFPNGVGVTSSR